MITFTSPGTHRETPDRALAQASLVNEALATIVHERGRRFTVLATLPLNDPAASVRTLERGVTRLGLKGTMLFRNVNEVALSLIRPSNLTLAMRYQHGTMSSSGAPCTSVSG